MEKISELLERFKKTLYQHKESRIIFKEAVSDCLRISIEVKNFSIKKDCVYIKCNSVVKNEIIINKQKILTSFYQKGGSLKILKIK